MRILICCNVYPPNFIGGAELIAHYQAKHLKELGHEVQVFAGEIQPRWRMNKRHGLHTKGYDGLVVHRVHLTGIDYNSNYINFSHPPVEAHFSRLLLNFRPDVVHCHNIIGLSVSILRLAHEFGAKVILTLHDHWGFCFKNTLMKQEGVTCLDYSRCAECQPFIDDTSNRRIPMRMRQDYMKLTMGAVDAFIPPSQYLADTYVAAGFPPEKTHVVWYGIDVDRFATIDRKPCPGVLRFSFFGYLGRHKGIHILLDALPLLSNKKRVIVNLIGNGDQQKAYERQLRDNGCTDLVKFWGKLDNSQVERGYTETDVLVLPSIWPENQPVSITEAMACGIPVLASNIGGIPELVKDGVSGYIFEPGNSADLAEKMDRLIADRSLVTTLGQNGQALMRNNSFARQVEKLQTIYREGADHGASMATDVIPTIICAGQRVHKICTEALRILPDYLEDTQPHFVMAEWLTEAQLRQASFAWVVDDSFSPANVAKLTEMGLPLLVPDWNGELLEKCRKHHCGLYYHDAHEAAACIAYLLTQPEEMVKMAHNTQSARLEN